jgi:hypothetical protein
VRAEKFKNLKSSVDVHSPVTSVKDLRKKTSSSINQKELSFFAVQNASRASSDKVIPGVCLK